MYFLTKSFSERDLNAVKRRLLKETENHDIQFSLTSVKQGLVAPPRRWKIKKRISGAK